MRVKNHPKRSVEYSVSTLSISRSSIDPNLDAMENLCQVPENVQQFSVDQDLDFPIFDHVGALNLSTKQPIDLDNNNNTGPQSENGKGDMKNSYLYRIMTDPNFVREIKESRYRISPPVVQEQITSTSAEQFSCTFCKRNFQCQRDLEVHLDVQLDKVTNQIACCACGKMFAQKRYLRYHQRCHAHTEKFVCEICSRQYSRLDNLTRHNVFHTNPNKFCCNVCDRTFARKDLLNKHVKCHENKFKFYCDVCKKFFKGKVSLKNHIKLFHEQFYQQLESA